MTDVPTGPEAGPPRDAPAPDGAVSPGARRLGRIAVHPILLAVYPALALWSANATEVLPGEVWPVVWPPALLAGVGWAALTPLLRSHRRAGIVVTVVALVALNLGRVVTTGSAWVAAGVLAVTVAGALALAVRMSRSASLVTTALVNVAAVVLVALTLPATVPSLFADGAAAASDVAAGDDAAPSRDIWYLIPDRYPRADTLAEQYGYDNTPFVTALEGRGFQVQDDAAANYPKTAHSLAATWNFELVEDLVTEQVDGDDWQPLYALLRDHRLGRVLTGAGYRYIHLGTWWSPTATAASADDVRRLDTRSEFASVWRAQTVLPAFATGDDGGETTLRELNRTYTTWQLDELDRLAALPATGAPRFVLAHITLPHEPYVFDADGALVTAEQEAQRSRETNIANQVTYLNGRLEHLVDTLLAGPDATDPIIVIQSDEGPTPAEREQVGGSRFDWTRASDAQLQEKLATLSAIHAPGVELPEDLTGVNTWRLLLDAYLGTDLGTVDAPIEVFTDEDHLYDFTEVTDRLR